MTASLTLCTLEGEWRVRLKGRLMKRITINDIARQLNVSACTVSKILNGKGNFSEPMKQLVVDTATEMGYTPNRLAEALVRRNLHILVVTTNEWPEYVGLLKRGVETQIDLLHDYHLFGSYLQLDRSQNPVELVQILQQELLNQPDAIILCGSDIFYSQPPILEFMSKVTCPIVLVGLDAPLIDASALVSHNSYLSGVMAAELLSSMIDCGDVAAVICNRTIPDSVTKLKGFTDETRRRGLNIVEVMETDDIPARASAMMQSCLKTHPELRGVYFATDNSAAACSVISLSGYTGKIRVVATGAFPELIEHMKNGVVQASLYQNMHQQGKLGVRLVYRLLTDRTQPDRQILIAPSIVMNSNWETVRDSDRYDLLHVV